MTLFSAVVNAMSALLDEVDQEIEARRKSSEVASQDLVNGTLSNGNAVKPQDEEQPTVKVLGMEMTASCEGGKKWSRPDSPVLPTSPPPPIAEPVPPPQEIYLEGALPAQSHLLVSESATEPEPTTGEDPAVVLSGKMTLSVISLESDNEVHEKENKESNLTKQEETEAENEIHEKEIDNKESNVTKQEETENNIAEPEHSVVEFEETQKSTIEEDIESFLQSLKSQAPSITLESEDQPETLEVESLEREVADLIEEAIQSIGERNIELEVSERTNDSAANINDNKTVEPETTPDTDIEQKRYNNVTNDFVSPKLADVEQKNISGGKEEITNSEISSSGAKIVDFEPQIEEPKSESDGEELDSDEELVEEIEEIVYEEESEEEESEEIVNDRTTNRTESSSLQRLNGERSVEESKYTTVSGATAAENDISEEELTDEEVEEEIIEMEEEVEEEEEYSNDEGVNHVSEDSDREL